MFGLKVVGWCSFDSDYPTKKYNEKDGIRLLLSKMIIVFFTLVLF